MSHVRMFRTSIAAVILACTVSGGNVHGQFGSRARIERVEYSWQPYFLSVRLHFNSGSNSRAVYGGASVALFDQSSGQRVIVDAPRDQVGTPGLSGFFAFTFTHVPLAPPYEFTVSLWEHLVDVSQCHAGPAGGPCEYCLKNGFHFEGRLDSREWIRVEPWMMPGQWQNR